MDHRWTVVALVMFGLLLLMAIEPVASGLSGSAEPGRGSVPVAVANPTDILTLNPGETVKIVAAASLPYGVKLFKAQRYYRGIPLFLGGLVLKQDPSESLQYSISSGDELNGASVATLVDPLFTPTLQSKDVSISLCQIGWHLDKWNASNAMLNVNAERYIYIGLQGANNFAMIIDDVRLRVTTDAHRFYRCLIDVSNQTVWKMFDNIQSKSPPTTTQVDGTAFGVDSLTKDPTTDLCLMAAPDKSVQMFDQKFSKNLLPLENSVYQFDCQQFDDRFKPEAQVLDYALRSKKCIEDNLNASMSTIVGDRGSIKLFAHYGHDKGPLPFFNEIGIYFANGVKASDALADSVDQVAFEMGYSMTASMSQMIYTGESGCVSDMFSGMTAKMVSQCLVDIGDGTVNDNAGGSGSDPNAQFQVIVPEQLSCNSERPSRVIDKMNAINNYDIYKTYRLFFGANRIYWSRFTTLQRAGCGVLQYARERGSDAYEIAGITYALAAGNMNPQSLCNALSNLRQIIGSTVITTDTVTAPTPRQQRPRSTRAPKTQVIPIYQLPNCIRLYGLSGKRGDLSLYKLTIPYDLPKKPTKLIVSLRIAPNDITSNADIYLKYGAPPQSRRDFDLGDHFEDGETTITVMNPPAGVYYVMLHAYDNYTDTSLAACYVNEPSVAPPPQNPVVIAPPRANVNPQPPVAARAPAPANAYDPPAGQLVWMPEQQQGYVVPKNSGR